MQSRKAISNWVQLAAHPATVRRALWTAAIVGTVLIAINHGPAIVAGELTVTRVWQMALTVLVPYLVSTVSSVATRRELGRRNDRHSQPPQKDWM